MRVAKQTNLAWFSAACLTLAGGMLAAQDRLALGSQASLAPADAALYDLSAATVVPEASSDSDTLDLRMAGGVAKLGESLMIEFSTDDKGSATIPFALGGVKGGVPGERPMKIATNVPIGAFDFEPGSVTLSGQFPNARLQMRVALAYAGGTMKPDGSQGGVERVFDSDRLNGKACASGCIAAFGEPALMDVEGGPLWRQADAKAAKIHAWTLPLLLMAGSFFWRSKTRPAVRKAFAALGAPGILPMPAKAPKIG